MLKEAKLDENLELEEVAKKTNHYSGIIIFYNY